MDKKLFIGFIIVQLMSFLTVFSQNGKVMHLNIHANSLEQNLAEESLDVSLGIYLPPGYEKLRNNKMALFFIAFL